MEIFYEYLVKRERTKNDKKISFLCNAMAVMVTIFAMFVLGLFMRGWEFLIIVAVWYGAMRLKAKTNVEYEYILTNSILDVDRIVDQQKRKRVISVDFKNIEGCEPKPVGGAAEIHGGREILNLTGNINGKNVYYVDFYKASERCRLYFQPNDKMLEYLKTINPRRVVLAEKTGDEQ